MFGTIPGDGTGQTIAIIDAYDYPTALADLQQFDAQFGLPDPPSFRRVAQDGTTNFPITDPAGPGNSKGTWEQEAALDIQWAHSIAPAASILFVEATDQNLANLAAAAAWASSQPGVVAVSMSFGQSETFGQTSTDNTFTTHSGTVTFLAASGDNGGVVNYPASSPNVIAVGGTTLNLSGSNYVSERGWSDSGGGLSSVETQPTFQQPLVTQSTTQRATPDVAMDADPGSGVAVYDSYDFPNAPWFQVGGTSLACPMWAGLIAIADQGRAIANLPALDGPTQSLPMLYQLPASDFHDITAGNNGFPAGPGYDLVTGRGTPIANRLIPDLAGVGSISGTVFQDNNSNGTLEGNDVPIPGVTVYLDANNNGRLDPASTSTVTSTDVPQTIPAGSRRTPGVGTSKLTFSGTTTPITNVTVNFTLNFPSDSSLTGYLVTPDNSFLVLFDAVGGSGQNFTNTTLSDQAATSIANAAAPFTGTFRPSEDFLSSLNGRSANGTWSLEIDNARRGVTGTIQSWSITITTAAEPSTVTDANGQYTFNSVPAGTYTVHQILPANTIQTTPGPGANPALDPVLSIAGNTTGPNFADFPTTFTAAGADSFYVALDPTQTYTQISLSSSPLAPPTYQIPVASLPKSPLLFNLAGGGLTLDFSNGDPLSPAGTIVTGDGASPLKIIGSASADSLTINATQLTFGTVPVNYSGIGGIEFDGGAGNDTLTIAAPLAFTPTFTGTGLDTLNIQAGTYAIPVDLSAATPDLDLALSSSASVTFSSTQHLAALSIGDSAIVKMTGAGGNDALALQGLSITGNGTLDIGDGDLIINTPDAATRDALLKTVTTLIGGARDGGAWDKPGITGSAAATDTSQITGLAVVANQKLDSSGNAGTIYDTFAGQSVDQNSILVRYTLNGDADLNGLVNFDDYFLINTGFLSNGALTGYRAGDFNFDGLINFDDYFLINTAFLGQSSHTPLPPIAKVVSPLSTTKLSKASVARKRTGKAASRAHRRSRHVV